MIVKHSKKKKLRDPKLKIAPPPSPPSISIFPLISCAVNLSFLKGCLDILTGKL